MPKIENIISSIKDKTFFDKCYSHFFMKTYKIYALFFKNKKIKKNKIVFCNFYGRGYGDNPKYIAEYILNNNLDYELVWIIDKNKCKNGDSLPDKIRKTKYKSFSSVKELSTAGIWIDNCRKDYFPSKKENQIYIQTWHGTFITKKIEADANLPAFYIKMAKKDSKEIDFLLSSNKKRTEQFKRCFWYDGPIIETGCPRDDILFQEDAKKNIKNKICRYYGIPSDKKILLYVPTFRNSHNLEPYNIDYKNILLAIEKRFGGNWQIITRLHPGMIVFSDKLHLPDFVINATLYNDMQELLCASDVIITDYSSMGDYSLYLKPLFMFCVDIEDYKKERGLEEDLEALPFPIAQNNDELLNNILHFDIEKYNKDLLTYYNDEGFSEYGHACQKVMKLIENKHGNESNEKSNKNNTSPLISVIIPCYNAEKYVESAVRSIMSQTYKNLEIIITDDCSTDNTFSILEKLADEDNRIKLYKNETNLKIVKTLNKMVLLANGKYIARMDADDISLPERIEKQVEFLEKNSDIAFCGTNAFIINENGKITRKTSLPITSEDNKFFLQFYSTFFHPSVMLRSKIYKENFYDENFLYAEDYELWARLIFQENLKGTNLSEKLFEYRIFAGQSSAVHQEKQSNASAKIFDKYRIVSDENKEFHKNLFFIHKSKKSEQELDYAKNIFKELEKQKFKFSFAAIQKLMFSIYKDYSKRDFFWVAIRPKGVIVLVKTVIQNIKK